MEISEVVNLNRIWLLLYGAFSGLFAFALYELAVLLSDKELRRKVKKKILMAFKFGNNPDKDKKHK